MTEDERREPGPVPEPGEGGVWGFVVGIVVALIVIAVLVYFLLLTPATNANAGGPAAAFSLDGSVRLLVR